jgi:hypothetical protein
MTYSLLKGFHIEYRLAVRRWLYFLQNGVIGNNHPPRRELAENATLQALL